MERANQVCKFPVLNNSCFCIGFLLLVALILLSGCRSNLSNTFENETEVIGAILAEDWARVDNSTKSVTAETPSVELRLIKGHALLALNKNNESSCLFLSVMGGGNSSVSENLKMWKAWTQNLADKNPNHPAAHYLKGDALSRLEQWDEAILSFNRALELNQNHALSLNARGLVYAFRQEWDPALMDLTKAISLNKAHTGAYANLGAYWMMKQVGAKGAEAAFDKALGISPEFVLALYGRACVKSVLGKWSDAQKDLEGTSAIAGCLGEFLHSSIALTLTQIQNDEEAILAQINSENPSNEVYRRVETMAKNGHTGFMGTDYKTVQAISHRYPELRPMIENKMSEIRSNNPKLANSISRTGNSIRNQSNTLEAFGNFLQTVKFKGNTSIDFYKLGKNISNYAVERRTLNDRSAPAGGFKTGLEEAAWDEGNWPFQVMNGFFYARSSK